jgi:ArsR family transcriptional regulator, virulence genes transcriptional regulator
MLAVAPLPAAEAETPDALAASTQRAATLLKALSHEARLLILCILAEGERTVTEIEAVLGMQQAVVSQHLARLRMENLVTTRREGRLIRYMLVDSEIRAVIGSLHQAFCGKAAV